MKVLVLGSSGQVASHLRRRLPGATFWGRATLDIGRATRLEERILSFAPTVIINAAAYTAVDAAENDAARAWRVNAEAPAAAARAAAALSATLIHLSTDYAFDGQAETPYTADTPTRPINTYGRTKVAGELAVASLCSRYWILRTSWIFSEFGSNFVKTMLRAGAHNTSLRIVADQFGRPTYAGHVAEVIERLLETVETGRLRWGTYHAVGGPVVSWHEFAGHIFKCASAMGRLPSAPELTAVTTEAYPTAARRPLRAVLEPSRELREATGCQLAWPDGLQRVVASTLELS